MKKRIDIASITSSKLRKGEYKSVLPEYYALSLVSENNPWHVNQNVFDHSVAVFVGLEGVLKLNFLKGIHKIKIQKHLDEKIGKSARKELLIVATVLHDIAKKDLLIKLPSGNTVCPAHEVIGSTIVKNFTSRFGLDKRGKEYVERMVHYHGFVNDILTLIIYKKQENKFFKLYKEIVGDVYIELLLFMYADMTGSDLKEINPKEFKAREKLIIELLMK